MMKRSEILYMVAEVPLDFCMLLLASLSAYYLRWVPWITGFRPVLFHITIHEYLRIASGVAGVWILVYAFAGLYTADPNRKFTWEMKRVVLASTAGLSLVAMYFLFTQAVFDSRFLVVISWILAIFFVWIGRALLRAARRLGYGWGLGARSVVLVGPASATERLNEILRKDPRLGYRVLRLFSEWNEETISFFRQELVDELILTNPRAQAEETMQMLELCNDEGITFKYSADLFDTYSSNIAIYPLAGIPIVELRRTSLEGWGRVMKATFDFFVSIGVIIICSPIMILVVIAILIETGRPVVYKNERIGRNGKKIVVYKFRSMYQRDCTGIQFGEDGVINETNEQELIRNKSIKEGPVYKIANDPRVTRVGKFLRRWSIDELPQFFNVLQGRMSIVGPRPHQPREVAKYEKRHRRVLALKPGITGLAQIVGRSDLLFEEEVRLDVLYIEQWSLLTDIIIFLKTPFILFKKRKAL